MTTGQWVEVLVSLSLQSAVVIGMTYVLERRVAEVRCRCAIWTACVIGVLLLLLSATLLPRLHLITPWNRLQPETLLSLAETQIVLGKAILVVWIAGTSVALLRWTWQGYQLHEFLRRCQPIDDARSRSLLALAGVRTESSEVPPKLLKSSELDGPFCWQMQFPIIVLPEFLLAGSEEDLRQVLRHELEHLRSGHPLQLFLQHLIQAIFWFNPLVWSAGARVTLVREYVCDEAAIGDPMRTAAYLRTLLKIAEHAERNLSRTLCFGRNLNAIVLRARRLTMIANGAVTEVKGSLGRGTALSLLGLTCVVASQCWIPLDVLSSSHSRWSPWPTWSAAALHAMDIHARDYEDFDSRVRLHELREAAHGYDE